MSAARRCPAISKALRAAGFAVDRVVLYAAEPVTTLPEAAAAALAEGEAAMGCCSIRRRTAEIWVRLVTVAGLGAAAASCVISACHRMWRCGSGSATRCPGPGGGSAR